MGKNYLARRIAFKIMRASLLYLATLAVITILGWLWGHSRTWSGLEDDYYFWKGVEDNFFFLGYVVFTLGEFAIFGWYLFRMGNYFQEILSAIERIQSSDDSWITLSDELADASTRINRLKTRLRQSQMQAREAEQRKNDLVVYLAHDLKTPLTSVLGYLSLLEENPNTPRAQWERFLSIARQKAERLEELINEFFEITRFNLTHIELEKRQIDFTLLLKQTVFEFRPMLEEKHLSCRLDGNGETPLYCDLDKMQRVVDNLLRNACHYAYENTEVLLGVSQTPDGNIRFTCTNQGPTIPAGKLERIFEQFYRLDNARTSSTGGAGLGLAIAKQIILLHGGKIYAESANEITTFTAELPANLKNS